MPKTLKETTIPHIAIELHIYRLQSCTLKPANVNIHTKFLITPVICQFTSRSAELSKKVTCSFLSLTLRQLFQINFKC